MEKIEKKGRKAIIDIDLVSQTGLHIAKLAAYFFTAMLLSRAELFQTPVSFGVSLVASLSGLGAVSAALGAMAGSFIVFSGTQAIRASATALGTAAVAIALAKTSARLHRKTVMPLTVTVMCLTSGVAVVFSQQPTLDGFLSVVCDSLLSGAMTVGFMGALSSFLRRTSPFLLDKKSLVCISVSACAFLTSLADLSFLSIHPARIFAVMLILFAAALCEETGGAVAGICAAVCVAASGAPPALCLCYAAGGLFAGIVSGYGQLALSAAISVTVGVCAVLSGTVDAVAMLAETAGAAIVFVLIPKKIIVGARDRLIMPEAIRMKAGFLAAPEKIENTSQAISEIADCIRTVANGIERIVPAEDEIIKQRVRERVCLNCIQSACGGCENTAEFERCCQALRSGDEIGAEIFSVDFSARCPSTSRLAKAFNNAFVGQMSVNAVEAGGKHYRELACGQFEALSTALTELSLQIKSESNSLYYKEKTARRVMEEQGLTVFEINCTQPADGAIRVNARIGKPSEKTSLSRLQKALGAALSADFDEPRITENGEDFLITFARKKRFRVRLGSAFSPCGGERLCGDYFETFVTDSHAYILLSDGMGTGGRAAIDSAMTVEIFSKLLRAGMSLQTSLEITNSALLIKSRDESIATLDVAAINLFTGETRFCKAGGAASFYCRRGRPYAAEFASLPLGILPDAKFVKTSASLSGGDMILLVSDGVTGMDNQTITQEIKMRPEGMSATDFASHILSMAKEKCGDRYDDMTVIAAYIEEI